MHHNIIEKKLDKKAHYFVFLYILIITSLSALKLTGVLAVQWKELLIFILLPVVLFVIYGICIGALLLFLKIGKEIKRFSKYR